MEKKITDTCRHSGVAGMMVVHDEDLELIARMRQDRGLQPIECEKCDYVYSVDKEWHLP